MGVLLVNNQKNILLLLSALVVCGISFSSEMPSPVDPQQPTEANEFPYLDEPTDFGKIDNTTKNSNFSTKARQKIAQILAEAKEKIAEIRATRFGEVLEGLFWTTAIVTVAYKAKDSITVLRKNNDLFSLQQSTVTFADIGGYEKEIDQLRTHILRRYKYPKKTKQLGIDKQPHTILYGPPGTGKTLMAQAMAGELGVPFLLVDGSVLADSLLGNSSKNVKRVLDEACDIYDKTGKRPLVICDEIDSFLVKKKNGGRGNTDKEHNNMVNHFLSRVGGIADEGKFVFLGTLNDLSALEAAAIRPGRLGKHIYIGLPDEDALLKIAEVVSKKHSLASEIDLLEIIQKAKGFSAADMIDLFQNAASITLREFAALNEKDLETEEEDKCPITAAHINEALLEMQAQKKQEAKQAVLAAQNSFSSGSDQPVAQSSAAKSDLGVVENVVLRPIAQAIERNPEAASFLELAKNNPDMVQSFADQGVKFFIDRFNKVSVGAAEKTGGEDNAASDRPEGAANLAPEL